MKKYTCPYCLSTQFVIRKTRRGDSVRFFCKSCLKYFSVSIRWLDHKMILYDHLEGLSFRSLGVKYGMSHMKAWRICESELKKLPDNNQFTYRYCSRFSKIFLFDGKYFPVADSKYHWVLLWGIDYLRHDIPVFTVAPAESYHTWGRFFSYLRILELHPHLLVCDDHTGLKMAARNAFPGTKIQTCYNHFKENIRRDLHIRSDEGKQYRDFMNRIESIISSQKISEHTFHTWLFSLYEDYRHDPLCLQILTNIQRYEQELLAYRGIHLAPVTTNLIEGMNGHLQARLQKLRSFQSIQYAKLWLNGYILKRRMTKYTDTRGKFKLLRGKTGVQMTQKQGVVIPSYF